MHTVNAQGHCTGSMHKASAQSHCTESMHRVNAQSHCTESIRMHRAWGTGHRAQGMGHSSSAHPVEVIMDGLEEDAAQHGASLAALIAMLIDEGGEAGHGGRQVLIQMEVCWDLDSHLVSLHMQELKCLSTM